MALGDFVKFKSDTIANWAAASSAIRVVPNGATAQVINADGQILYSVVGNGVDDIFDLPRNWHIQKTITVLPQEGFVFDYPKSYFIQQQSDIVLQKSSEGHDDRGFNIPIDVTVIGDNSNSLSDDFNEISIGGDLLRNSERNFIRLIARNGIIEFADNKNSAQGEVVDSFAPTLSNFRINNANKDRVYFDSSEVITGSTFTGFTITGKTITSLVINTGNLSGHYFVMNSEFVEGDTPTITYVGGSNIQDDADTPNALEAFTATAITNNISDTFALADLSPQYLDETEQTFNGSSDFVDMGNLASVFNGDNYEVYRKVTIADGQPAGNQNLFGINQDNTKGAMGLLILPTGAIRIQHKDANGDVVNMDSGVLFADEAIGETVINVRKIGLNFSLYVDGSAEALTVSTIAANSALSSGSTYDGALNNIVGSSVIQYFEGTSKVNFVLNRALTPTERTDVETIINAL